MIEWKPIKDAPRDGMRVLLGRNGSTVVQGSWLETQGAWVIAELYEREDCHEIFETLWEEGKDGPTHYAEITPVPEVKP